MHSVEAVVHRWLETVIVGLGLCPFAAQPLREGRVRIVVSAAREPLALLSDLQIELQRLEATPPASLETTLIAVPHMLAGFAEYNDFLDEVDALLEGFGWSGLYQVASFHPGYRFADVPADDPGNLTNRSPVPLLHLLREDSVAAAVAVHSDIGAVPEENVRRLRSMDAAERARLFAYLADAAA